MKNHVPQVAYLLLCMLLMGGTYSVQAQKPQKPDKKEVPAAVLSHLKEKKAALKLTDEDLEELAISSETVSKKSNTKHYYIQQLHNGIEIQGAITTVNVKDDQVISVGNRFHKELGKKIKTEQAAISAEDAIGAAARYLGIAPPAGLQLIQKKSGKNQQAVFSRGGISQEPIPAKLVYQPMEDGSLRLAWEIEIYELSGDNWWNIRIDANSGAYLAKDNYVAQCTFENQGSSGEFLPSEATVTEAFAGIPYAAPRPSLAPLANGAATYNVLPVPVESPNHGSRSIVSEAAANALASPAGWHTAGATNYTITRGNNVYAYEDPDNTGYVGGPQDMYGYSPDAGPSLVFDYPIDYSQQPETYRDAAITNLFYWNNVIHDVWYQYGFDEASGNFQTSNLGRGGLEADHVMAEAQDGRNIGNRNNANFATPPDGIRPRMQMYLWTALPDPEGFEVTSPASIAGFYDFREAGFGGALTNIPLTGKLVLALDGGGASTEDGCEAITNAAAISGNIAVVYRGSCTFVTKVLNAQNAGAIAVVVINNQPGILSMGGADASITIPSVMVSQDDGALFRARLDAAEEVLVALKNEQGPEIDGDLDNGIITHEYGHGISNRLTGGPNTTSCLGNAEQAGEGWSDWFGLMMTMKAGDTREKVRGIGTYAISEPVTGGGIRPAPYSTDFAINNATYATTNDLSISQPHGIGFVWATALWEMTWDLIDAYGFDPDLYNGQGGNNMAMQLVIDGLKLQPCRPGHIESRDAILLADRINYGGANQELIWEAFARRGYGFSASQGSNNNREDQVEAFDLPSEYLCTLPLNVAAIPTNAVYTGGIATNLYLGYGPQSVMLEASGDPTNTYSWSPAAGLSATNIANPIFTPTAAGTYTFTVEAVNADQCTKYASITIEVYDVRCGNNNEKVLLCHNGKDKCIAVIDVQDHLAHGDQLNACGSVTAVAQNLELSALPNPFSKQTTLKFKLNADANYQLEIRNSEGTLLQVLTKGSGLADQTQQFTFDRGSLRDGLYLIRLVTDKEVETVRLLIGN